MASRGRSRSSNLAASRQRKRRRRFGSRLPASRPPSRADPERTSIGPASVTIQVLSSGEPAAVSGKQGCGGLVCVDGDVEGGELMTTSGALAGGDQLAAAVARADGQHFDLLADD